ncbi:transposase-like protein [Colletotrichum musicola]|uniref:Transposase-like protein n=1 Tax=Colletotrichum musicola TaxID=2175873 RepID=A0A8H6JMV6_9PEZI|nr:transposase-like protein [Colletotrichum musicola]
MSTVATTASASYANAYEILGIPRFRISTQIAQALLVTPPLNPTIDDLPHVVVGSQDYKVCRISTVSDEDSDSSTLPSSVDTSGSPSYKRLRPNSNVPRAKITTLRDLSVASVVSADLLFVYFENAYVQQMFWYYNPEVAGEIP